MLAAVLSCINYYNKAKELALLSQNSKLIHELHRMQFQAWKHSDLLLNVVQVVTVSVQTPCDCFCLGELCRWQSQDKTVTKG
jgi:hypothetical protein